MALRTLLFDPDEYFQTWRGRSLGRAALVVGLAWAVLVASIVVVMLALLTVIAPPATAWEEAIGAILSTSLLMLPVLGVAWLLETALLHVAARVSFGEGSFGDTAVVVGLGYAPTLVEAPIEVVWLLGRMATTDFGRDPAVVTRQFGALTTEGPFGLLLQIGVLAWTAYIWTYGLRHRHDLALGTAAKAAGAVAVLRLLLELL